MAGTKAPDGRVVRLEAIRLGGRWLTSVEALQRFAAALTPSFAETDLTSQWRSPRKRQGDSERAGKQLDQLGIR
jgi:hypothetical protein